MNILTNISVFKLFQRILALLLCFSIYTQGQDNSLVLSPEKPEAGQKLSLTYTGRMTLSQILLFSFTKVLRIICFDSQYEANVRTWGVRCLCLPTRLCSFR